MCPAGPIRRLVVILAPTGVLLFAGILQAADHGLVNTSAHPTAAAGAE